MEDVRTDEVREFWQRIRDWPEQMQLSLAARILQSLGKDVTPRRKTLADLVGLLASDEPPPTDHEVEMILQEERSRKFA